MISLSKHIYRSLTPQELQKVERDRVLLEQEKPRILELARLHRERHDRLREIYATLRHELEAQSMSLEELADQAYVPLERLIELEQGWHVQPRLDELESIAQVLHRTLQIELVDREAA